MTASFDTVSQEWLIRFVEHRIGDRRITRLIRKWLKAGVLEDGIVAVSDKGIGQGAVISPLLANIYLHYALDLPSTHEASRVHHVARRHSSSVAARGARATETDAGDWVSSIPHRFDPTQTVSANFANVSKILVMSRAKTW